MDHLTSNFSSLLAPFAPCFRAEVFVTFQLMATAWVVCLGRRTISRLWETTGHANSRDHSAAFRLFNQAAWNWDEVCRILLVRLLAALVPGTTLWLVTDDTLCHKRGAKVAFGGMAPDALRSPPPGVAGRGCPGGTAWGRRGPHPGPAGLRGRAGRCRPT